MQTFTVYRCSHGCGENGYTPGNRRNWCNGGCGSDYNEMVPTVVAVLDDLVAEVEHVPTVVTVREQHPRR